MSNLPEQARVVIIGAGIVGNSVSYHLARLGWKDVVLVDKGPLPNPGGSTGHASNFIYPVDHSKEMTLLTQDSVEQYREMGVFVESGGFEVARTDERVEELKRRVQSAKAWGEPAEILSPEEVNKKVPFLNTEVIKAGFWSPTAGVCDPLRAGTIMRERAQAMDALTLAPRVWYGAISAAVLSLAAGILLTSLGLQLKGKAEEIFDGFAMIVAAGVLTWMIFWMRRQARHIKERLESGVEQAALQMGRHGLFALAFLAALREGIELALFLTAAVFAS